MQTKLTLSLEKDVIENAKLFAKGTGRSLSEMVENYFRSLTENNTAKTEDLYHAKLNKISGVITLPKDFDEKKSMEEYLENKYIK
jgi:Family of unknown function (DUF6364)